MRQRTDAPASRRLGNYGKARAGPFLRRPLSYDPTQCAYESSEGETHSHVTCTQRSLFRSSDIGVADRDGCGGTRTQTRDLSRSVMCGTSHPRGQKNSRRTSPFKLGFGLARSYM